MSTYKTCDTKSGRVKLRCLASAVLDLENISKVGPSVIDDGHHEIDVGVAPVVGVVEGIGVLGLFIDKPLEAAAGGTKTVACDFTSVSGNVLSKDAGASGRDDTVGLEGA